MNALVSQLSECRLPVNGKSTFKEEFVTAGGVALHEVDFRRFESKRIPGLFLAGEVLDIDALTGGFNFQAAWTGGWLAGEGVPNVEFFLTRGFRTYMAAGVRGLWKLSRYLVGENSYKY